MRRFLLALLLCGPLLPACAAQPAGATGFQPAQLRDFQRSTVTIERRDGRDQFQAWLALTQAEWEQGLMWIRSLPPDYGMLFVAESPRETAFWMKNTYVSLDILFFDETGKIIRIEHRATPLSEKLIPSGGVAGGVFEILGGESERRGIKIGDRIVHPMIKEGRR